MAQIIKGNGGGGGGKLSNYVADVSYENWSDLDKAISGKKVYDKVSSMVTDIGNKQDKLTPGTGIDITSNVISTTALPGTTKYGASFVLSIDTSTYVVTAQLKDQDGNNLGTAQTIDLPLESVVVNGRYDDTTKKIILTLQNGNTIEFSVADLVSGLQTEITNDNKLSADLVDDTSTTNKFVTAAEKTTWGGKQDALTAGSGIDITSNTVSTASNFGRSTTAAATVQKEVSIPGIKELHEGQIVHILPSATSSVANSTLKVNNFDAYPMRYNNAAITTSTDSIVRPANIVTTFVFDGTYRQFVGHGLDSNTTYTINYSIDAGRYQAGTGTYAITRYSLVMEKDNGTWEKITATNANYSTGTTKNVNTNGFKLGHIRYYNTTTTYANGAFAATNTFHNKAASVNGSYSFNCGTAPGRSIGDYIYLVGSIGNDGLFYLDTTKRRDTDLPTTKNGKLYIRLGIALTTTDSTFSFLDDRPIFYYDNGIKIYKQADNKQDIISDLSTIRSGAAAGATALQSGDNISELANNSGYITNADVPTKTSDLDNDSGFITSSALSGYQTTANMVTSLANPDNDHYPTALAVSNAISSSGGGDVTGPASSTDGHLAVFNGNTGKIIKDGGPIPSYTASDFDIKDLADSTNLRTTWSGKQDALSTQTAYTSKGSATKVPQITTNSLGQVTGITEVTIDQPSVGNGTFTVKQGGTSKATFSANQSSNGEVDLNTSFLKTQAEYDALPSSKNTDGNFYFIYNT